MAVVAAASVSVLTLIKTPKEDVTGAKAEANCSFGTVNLKHQYCQSKLFMENLFPSILRGTGRDEERSIYLRLPRQGLIGSSVSLSEVDLVSPE